MTAELQAIRKRDARLHPTTLHQQENIDRRTLLALYDAQSEEVRRLREALLKCAAIGMPQHRNQVVQLMRGNARAALGSAP